jgi:DNA-binding NtrC family response regulator
MMQALAELSSRLLRVLVVEDEARLRDLLAEVVPEMGFPTTAVRSAEEALRIMQGDPHEILILDLQLPLMGGMELFQRVRADWPATQVIVTTGFGDLATAQLAIRLEVVEFLSKPCHLYDVEQALEHARRRLLGERPATPISPQIEKNSPATLAESEFQQILAALRRHNGNKTAAAAELGISRRTIHYRLAEYRAGGMQID